MLQLARDISISIHALRKESDHINSRIESVFHTISIHALRKESDSLLVFDCFDAGDISIHALRKESDLESCVRRPFRIHFNPRSP